jgi:hypothetical protein
MKQRLLGGLVLSLLMMTSTVGDLAPVDGLFGPGSASADLK